MPAGESAKNKGGLETAAFVFIPAFYASVSCQAVSPAKHHFSRIAVTP
jgi:hypothetical protein